MPTKSPKLNREIGYIKPREIVEEMKTSYIDYAMSVIISRALPDVRDGLKPVHRRILYSMYEDGLKQEAKFRKAATVVGSCLGRYHPHGDIPVYDALVRMAQNFTLRYPLILGQGNFGSIDGDPPAAMRYTECKLSKIGQLLLKDIEKNTVEFVDNYDATRKEPKVLPSPFPNLLINGSLGIAVGMATNIPPHNLSEVIEALIYLISHKKATTADLFKFIKGPDFPTGGQIFNQKEIISAYSQGKGPILVRGKAEILKEEKTGKNQIIISEIPFLVRKSELLEQIANLVQEKKIEGIKDVRDESDKEGMRIVIELQRGALPQKILNSLYKFTDFQKTFHLNMVALIEGIQPRVLSLVDILNYFLEHRKEVIFKRTKYDLEKAKERAHILEGLAKCLRKIDAVIKVIKSSKNREMAEKNLIKKFKLTKIQANAILETKLSILAKLEREKIEKELKEILFKIKEFNNILKSPQKIKEIIKNELKEIKELFGDQRKTKVYLKEVEEISKEDLIPKEETIITLTKGGYIKRITPLSFRKQKRGGKGILGAKTIGEDIVEHFLVANTHDNLLFFLDSGKVFSLPVSEIPEGTRLSKGRGLLNFLDILPQEKVLALFSLAKEKKGYLMMVTENGIIKKTNLEKFKNVKRSGLRAIFLKKGDLLKEAKITTGEDEVVLVTKKGQVIRFKEKQIREMGREAAGIRAIKLRKDDKVIGMEIVQSSREKGKDYLLVVSEQGFGKKTDLREFKLQGRAGRGTKGAKITEKTGDLIASLLLTGKEKDLIVISQKGQAIRIKINAVAKMGRFTQGIKLMKLEKGDKVASVISI
jgi:DNA gyrase subunit A